MCASFDIENEFHLQSFIYENDWRETDVCSIEKNDGKRRPCR